MNQVTIGYFLIEFSILICYLSGCMYNLIFIILEYTSFTTQKKIHVLNVQEYNSAEGRKQISTYSDKGGFGFINRGLIDGKHITGGVSKKNDILKNGMGKDVHFEYSMSLKEVDPEIILTEDFWNYHVTEMKMHVIKQTSHGNAKFDKSHIQQMYDKDFAKHMIENFRPLVHKVKGKSINYNLVFPMGGNSPRVLITFENMYNYLKQNYNITLNIIGGMWGTVVEEYDITSIRTNYLI